MDAREFLVKRVEIVIAVVSLAALFAGAYQAFASYKQEAKLQALRALHESQLNACTSISVAGAKLLSARDSDELFDRFVSFSELKHGQGLMLLDASVLDSAVALHNALVPLLNADSGPSFRKTVRCGLGDLPFKLSLACRHQLSNAYSRESGDDALMPIASDYVISWKGECGQTASSR
jgi:hypothetical protein